MDALSVVPLVVWLDVLMDNVNVVLLGVTTSGQMVQYLIASMAMRLGSLKN